MGEPNQPGLIVRDFIERCSLHVLSLSMRAEGQNYTFWNSVSETTVDYILGDYEASCSMISCCTLECDSLNTSDHLPITANFRFNDIPSLSHATTDNIKVNWSLAKESPCLSVYQNNVSAGIHPLLGKGYDNVDDLNSEIL